MKDGLAYLNAHPTLYIWVNQCKACGTMGYKPELPDIIYTYDNQPTSAGFELRSYFNPLEIDKTTGHCLACNIQLGETS